MLTAAPKNRLFFAKRDSKPLKMFFFSIQRLLIASIIKLPLLTNVLELYLFSVEHRMPLTGKLKLHESTTCILWPKNFSFYLPVVLKTDFERRNGAS